MDAKQVFPDPRTAELAAAAASGDAGRVKALVRDGANVNARGDKNVTLLQWAMLNMMTPEVRRGRDAVRNWLRTHHIPIEDAPAY